MITIFDMHSPRYGLVAAIFHAYPPACQRLDVLTECNVQCLIIVHFIYFLFIYYFLFHIFAFFVGQIFHDGLFLFDSLFSMHTDEKELCVFGESNQ